MPRHPTIFNRVFNQEFNISFFIPRKEQCDLCESYKNADDDQNLSLFGVYNIRVHQEEKELARKENDPDKKKLNVAVYDLQAVLPLPKGLACCFYYKNKIYCYK